MFTELTEYPQHYILAGGGNLEPKIIEEPLAYDEQNKYLRRDGIVGTLTTDGSSPKHNNRVVEPLVYDGFNRQVRADQTTVGCLTRNVGADLKRNGQGIIEPTIWGSLQEHCAVKQDGVCPTLTQAMGAGGGQIPMTEVPRNEYELSESMKRYINSYDDKYQVSDSKLVLNKPIASPITTREGSTRADASSYISKDFGENENIAGKNLIPYRVRKLTEKECFRLQGVKDEDFAKIRKNQSKSSCYHLAGDSITTSVLMALFGEMIEMDWRTKVNDVVEKLQDKE